MRSRVLSLTASGISTLLLTMLVSTANSLTLVALPNRAGLPHPEEGYRGGVYLKEATVTLDIDSSWAELAGYRRWHSATISHKARYVFENTGNSTSVAIKIPMAGERGLKFKLDGREENYTDVEYVEEIEPPLGSSVIVAIYTLTVNEFPAQTQKTVEVEAEQGGAAAAEARYIYFMCNASRWMKPIEEFDVVLNLRNGEFRGSTIDPTTQRTDEATWEMKNLTPFSDLVLHWRISEPPEALNLPLVAIIISVAILVTSVGLIIWRAMRK